MWEGLGYYNRVRNLKRAAVYIEENFSGQMPDSYDLIVQLPGIGSYTAGAIASIAFERRVPAVDGNVLRILTRVLADDSDIMKQSVRKHFEERLNGVIPEEHPGDFNQALMELGALICIPNGQPKCESCPLAALCEARKLKIMDRVPFKGTKQKRVIEKKTVLIIRDDERTALRKRPTRGLLAGMYEFPNLPGHLSSEAALEYVKSLGLSPLRIQKIEDSKHIFSHKEWHMSAYTIRVEAVTECMDMIFAYPFETEEKYPIPAAFGAYTKYLDIRIGNERFKENT